MENKFKYLLFIGLILNFLSCDNKDDYTYEKPYVSQEKLTDEELMDLVQSKTFKYFWNFAESNSGAARERYTPSNSSKGAHIVTTGGSGFGLMAILVGIERNYISKSEGVARLSQILTFFENADRFHGAWSHWINGENGSVIPFSTKDNGGDIVETAFFAQGLICVYEYLKDGSTIEKAVANQANTLWKGIEWNWYTQNQNKLYWHWSPNYNFDMNMVLTGYNETLIAYILGASSPNYSITKNVYTEGWARNGAIVSSEVQYNYPLILDHAGTGTGPLFWAHYSYLGLNPTSLSDTYANYWDVNVNHSKINYEYCVNNPKKYAEYGEGCWGLTSSYTRNSDGSIGYAAHRPSNDLSVIAPTAAVSSIVYTPTESLAAMHYFYDRGNLMGVAGFYDAFSPKNDNWVAEAYLAIDQGPQIIMIENYRTGLLWNLFMQNQNVKNGLNKLGFSY